MAQKYFYRNIFYPNIFISQYCTKNIVRDMSHSEMESTQQITGLDFLRE
jgi:hypothetical protein